MKTIILLLVMLSYSIGAICQANQDSQLQLKLDQAFANIFSADAPGGSVFIQKGKKILYERSFGLADIKTKGKFTPATVANLGSISKTFVAYGILLLQKQGKLSVDDNLLEYFPDFKNKAIAQKVTIRHLMSHTSGLPDLRKTGTDSVFYLTAKDAENFEPLKSADSLEFEPGSHWKYSNPAYNGLALIIEKVTHRKWQDFIRQNIFQPAHMDHSRITDGAFPESGVAHGYRKVNGVFEEYDYGEYPTFCAAGNGGVWSSIDDLRKYANAIKTCAFMDCSIIKKTEQVWKPINWSSADPMVHTTVWFNHKGLMPYYAGEGRFTVIEHTGDQGGFKAHLLWIPEKEMTIIWITNNDLFITDTIEKVLLETGYLQ
ncbi:serine hydrolase domain-containing protein [Flavihumibacter fluvii]|uniref:serine hydrolase domain-containing protein n=1 Tax=Flavihumibacter fluvii TaxID=2838157 RepID=UPI001BDECBFD|nr:serine hydrolase domain-containing protein [Flavihumibacter fluvii]ULQ54664.1 beta-lactamase family protein [Flavihumibacter fluvii]